jgi:putative tryptophan/tyrosine transport system substrate-binding protein
MKIILKFILITTAIINSAYAAAGVKKIYISQVVNHPALDSTTKGIIEGLAQAGYQDGKNIEIIVESAQGSSALASQIASKFVSNSPDVVVGVGTISAQSFVKYAKENRVKMVFSTVTDPLGAGIVKDLTKPGDNISGVSNFVELEPQIELFKKLQPDLKTLGIIYNPGESNSVSIIKKLEEICPKFGIKLIKQTATKTLDVSQAAAKLTTEVNAIFITNDNTALSALQVIIQTANKAKIPVYVSDIDAIQLGALAAFGPNQYQVGFQTARIIIEALAGKDIGKIPVEFPKKIDLVTNQKAAQLLGIKF